MTVLIGDVVVGDGSHSTHASCPVHNVAPILRLHGPETIPELRMVDHETRVHDGHHHMVALSSLAPCPSFGIDPQKRPQIRPDTIAFT